MNLAALAVLPAPPPTYEQALTFLTTLPYPVYEVDLLTEEHGSDPIEIGKTPRDFSVDPLFVEAICDR